MTTNETATSADVNSYLDPVCPFAWMTSKWLRMVTAQRNWRPIESVA
jgi:predicted DsbA family dithiol-disulfide isomerase